MQYARLVQELHRDQQLRVQPQQPRQRQHGAVLRTATRHDAVSREGTWLTHT